MLRSIATSVVTAPFTSHLITMDTEAIRKAIQRTVYSNRKAVSSFVLLSIVLLLYYLLFVRSVAPSPFVPTKIPKDSQQDFPKDSSKDSSITTYSVLSRKFSNVLPEEPREAPQPPSLQATCISADQLLQARYWVGYVPERRMFMFCPDHAVFSLFLWVEVNYRIGDDNQVNNIRMHKTINAQRQNMFVSMLPPTGGDRKKVEFYFVFQTTSQPVLESCPMNHTVV
jgi:hypothetical protein